MTIDKSHKLQRIISIDVDVHINNKFVIEMILDNVLFSGYMNYFLFKIV